MTSPRAIDERGSEVSTKRDIRVRIGSLAALAIGLASCGGGTARNEPGTATAAAVSVAYLFTDQQAQLSLVSGATPPAMAPAGADVQHTVWVSGDGTLVGAVVSQPVSSDSGCDTTPIAATGQRRTVPTDFATIQAAIDAAQPGDVVFVEPGTYHESLHLRSNVSVLGASAEQVILDAGGAGQSLIDYTGAHNAVVQGLTLTGVGPGQTCPADDPFFCSGDYYPAAIFGDGHDSTTCANTSVLITQNIIRGNTIGVMAYFQAQAVVRNNVFVGNQFAFIANHLQDHALVLNNAFFANAQMAIGSQAAYLDVVDNIIVGSSVGVSHEFVQTGRIFCNAFAAVDTIGDRVPVGEQGNLTVEPAFVDPSNGDFSPTPALVQSLASCADLLPSIDGVSPAEPGAYGGALGEW